jgi:hypothetical protein
LFSYQGNYLDGWGNGFTRGIFQQSVGQGSFNGHGRKQRRRGLRGNMHSALASGSESVPYNGTAV